MINKAAGDIDFEEEKLILKKKEKALAKENEMKQRFLDSTKKRNASGEGDIEDLDFDKLKISEIKKKSKGIKKGTRLNMEDINSNKPNTSKKKKKKRSRNFHTMHF